MRLLEGALVFVVVLAAGALFMAATREFGVLGDDTAASPIASAVAPQDAPVEPQVEDVSEPIDVPEAAPVRNVPAWKPAPRAPARITLDAPSVSVRQIGNCSGPPSPGEFLDVSSNADYTVDGQSQLLSGATVGSADGATTAGTSRWWIVDGSGSLEWAESMRIPAVADDRDPGRLQVRAWASTASGEPIESKAASLQLGTTLVIRVVDDEGNDVPGAAVTVQNAGCERSRGATYVEGPGRRVAFYHIDPAERAKVFATAPGYHAAEMVLNPKAGELTAGALQDVEFTIQSRVNFQAMGAELESLVDGMLGQEAIAVTDLESGRTISVNGTRRQVAGCTIKVVLMMALAQDIAAGKYTKEDIADPMQRMMGPSQVWPAYSLIELVGDGDIGAGLRRINQIMWDLGATRSMITHPPGYYWEEYGYLAMYDINENVVTAEDFNLILSKLWKGDVPLDEASREYVLWSMTLAPGFLSGALGGPLPYDVSLYHKMGQLDTWSGAWNDVGIVDFEGADGKRYTYVISVLGSNSRWRDHYDYGAQLSSVVWKAFATAYGYGG